MAEAEDKITEFLGEEGKETPPEKTPEKTETPPEEKGIPVEIDTSALKEEVRSEVSKEISDKLVKSLVGEKIAEEDKSPWEKEGRNPNNWDEVADYVLEKSEKKRSEIETQTRKAEEDSKKAVEAANQRQNEVWDWEISQLQESGKLPKVAKKDDPDDPGVKAIRDLFEVATVAAKEGKLPHKSLTAAYYQFYQDKFKQPPGSTAPISGGKKTVGSEGEEYSREELRNASFYDILGNSQE